MLTLGAEGALLLRRHAATGSSKGVSAALGAASSSGDVSAVHVRALRATPVSLAGAGDTLERTVCILLHLLHAPTSSSKGAVPCMSGRCWRHQSAWQEQVPAHCEDLLGHMDLSHDLGSLQAGCMRHDNITQPGMRVGPKSPSAGVHLQR